MAPVSVIIPTKRRNDYLQRAIQSVVLQAYPCLEICIVDNNDEPDLSEEVQKIVANYKLLYNAFTWIYLHRSQKYASGTKNDRLEIISSKYVCFLDDDELLPDSITTRVKIVMADPQLALLYCAGTL